MSAESGVALLSACNGPRVDYDCVLLHELVERQAAVNGKHIAVISETDRISYRELNSRANTVAKRLARLGIGPGKIVGVYVPRSIEMVVALLGVLKAGAAYLPFDPTYPAARLEFMAQDAQIPVLITNQNSLPFAPKAISILRIDECTQQSNERPGVSQDGADLAYVIYTSGSTGRPKGVEINHRGISNRLLWMQDAFKLSAGDRVLHKTPVGFDVSGWEIFWPLIAGSTMVLARPGGEKEPRYLVHLIRSFQVTVLHFVPAMLRAFLEEDDLKSLSTLRDVICSGEALDSNLRDRFFERAGARLHNLYGPTEASIDVTHWEAQPTDSGNTVPIGRPIFNTQIYILDEKLRLKPAGERGEICIGGWGVARGYHRRPELSAQSFVADPFHSQPGQLMYRTGDYGYFRSDGVIEFIGRIDNQIKIRGQRIELAEIESVLDEHPAVEKCIVVFSRTATGGELGAWILVKAGTTLALSDLQMHASQRLSEAACPSEYFELAEFPRTVNGKIDRQTLAEEWQERQLRKKSRRTGVSPSTPTEVQLAEIWTTILGYEECGIHDSFLELGGNSIHAAMMLSQINSVFGVDLPLRTIFDCGTIQQLAACIDLAEQAVEDDGDPAPTSNLSPNQAGLWFLGQVEPRSLAYNIPLAVVIEGVLQPEEVANALNVIVSRHQALRTTFDFGDDGPITVVASHHQVSLPVHTEPETLSAAVKRVLDFARTPFDLSVGPLYRFEWIPLSDAKGMLAVVVHHIIFDEWSWTLFIAELSTLLNQKDVKAPLPKLPESVALQNRQLNAKRMATQLSYWRNKLADCPATITYPRAIRRAEHSAARNSTVCEVAEELLPDSVATSLITIGAENGSTLFMVILTAFKALLLQLSEQTDLVVACPFAYRKGAIAEKSIGFFVNTLLLRSDLAGNPTFTEALARVRETVLEAYTNQDVSFSEIIADLNPARRPGELPLLQVVFILRNLPELSLAQQSVRITTVEVPELEPKFDLKLDAVKVKDGIRLRLIYRPSLFESSAMRELGHDLVQLLTKIANEPHRRLSEYLQIGVEPNGKTSGEGLWILA